MRTHTPEQSKKEEMIRFRCEIQMKADVGNMANFLGLDEADIGRMAMRRLISDFKSGNVMNQSLSNRG